MTASEQIIQVINDLCTKFGIAIDWTSENIIPYISTLCTKLISWEIWSSVALIAIMIVLTIVSIIATKLCYPTFKRGWIENSKSYTDVGWQVSGTLAIIGLIGLYVATIAVVGTQIFDIIKCNTFPELFVFEYIQNMINCAA